MKFAWSYWRCVATLLIIMNVACGQSVGMPADVASCLEKASVTEPYSLQAPDGCKEILAAYMRDHWREVVAEWDAIASTDEQKWVFLNVAETLEPAEYLEFLESARTLRQTGKISSDMFEVVTVLPGQRKEAFLALNYNNPRVRDYIASIRGLLPASQSKYFDEVLSGLRGKAWEERYRKAKIEISSNLLLSEKPSLSATPAPPISVPTVAAPNTTATPAPQPGMPIALPAKRRASAWLWIVAGIAALLVILALVLRRVR
jgi:hypothetical protein